MNEIPQELYKILFITSASFSVWTILNILINKKPFNDLHKTIIFYLVVLMFPPINAYCRIVFDEPTIWLQNVAYNLTWLYGPLILLIVKQVFLYPISEKILAIHLVLPFFVLIDRVSGTFFTENYILFFYLLMFQTFIYLSYSSYVCIKNKSKLKQLFKGHKNTTYYWMMFLIIGLFVLNFMDLIIINDLIAGKASNMDAMSAIAGLVSLYVSLISTLAIFQTDNFQLQIIDTSDDTLEAALIRRIRMITFPASANVVRTTLRQTFDFLPQ